MFLRWTWLLEERVVRLARPESVYERHYPEHDRLFRFEFYREGVDVDLQFEYLFRALLVFNGELFELLQEFGDAIVLF